MISPASARTLALAVFGQGQAFEPIQDRPSLYREAERPVLFEANAALQNTRPASIWRSSADF
jgi:hypothetical protein